MSDGRRKDDWHHTARICSLLAEPHRDKKKRPSPYEPDDFHPYAAEIKKATKISISKEQTKQIFKSLAKSMRKK